MSAADYFRGRIAFHERLLRRATVRHKLAAEKSHIEAIKRFQVMLAEVTR